MSAPDNCGPPVKVTLYVMRENYDALTMAAAEKGISTTDAFNQAAALYGSMMDVESGDLVTWSDHEGNVVRKFRVVE